MLWVKDYKTIALEWVEELCAVEDDINRITNTTAWTNLWLNKALSHTGVSYWVTEKVAAVQTLPGDSNRQPCGLKPTALTRPGWHHPRRDRRNSWDAFKQRLTLTHHQPTCIHYHLTTQHSMGAGNGNSLSTRGNKLSSYIRFT